MRSRLVALATGLIAVVVVPVTVPAAQAAGSVRSAITLTAPASGEYGTTIKVGGRLWRYGTAYGIQGGLVWLQRAPHGRTSWANITNARTASNGNYSFTVTQTGAFDYRVYYSGSATYTAALSPVRYPVTTQRVLLDSVATTDSYTGAMQVRGRVFPSPPNGTTVYLQRWDPTVRTWYTIEAGRVAGGAFTVGVHRPASVTAYRIIVPARAPYGIGVSAATWFANYVWRGAFARPVSSNPPGHYSLPDNDPRRDRITVAARSGTTIIGINTSGCRRITASTTSPPWDIRPVQLSLHTDRVRAEATLEPRRTTTTTADLAPAETVVGFQHVNPDSIIPIDSTASVLCAN